MYRDEAVTHEEEREGEAVDEVVASLAEAGTTASKNRGNGRPSSISQSASSTTEVWTGPQADRSSLYSTQLYLITGWIYRR